MTVAGPSPGLLAGAALAIAHLPPAMIHLAPAMIDVAPAMIRVAPAMIEVAPAMIHVAPAMIHVAPIMAELALIRGNITLTGVGAARTAVALMAPGSAKAQRRSAKAVVGFGLRRQRHLEGESRGESTGKSRVSAKLAMQPADPNPAPGRPPVAGALSRSRARPGKVPIVATIPKSRLDQIQFCEDHINVWVNEAENIGLSGEQVADLTGLTTQARAAYIQQQAAKQSALAATADFHDKTDAMRSYAGALVSEIQAYAKSTDDPNVFVLAQIPAPAQPTPYPAPAAPFDLSFTLQSTGVIEVRWKAPQPAPGAEVVTQITRRLDGAGSFTTVQVTGDKVFLDDSVPPGTQSVTYVLYAKRAGATSAPSNALNIFLGNVNFGEGGEEGLSLAA